MRKPISNRSIRGTLGVLLAMLALPPLGASADALTNGLGHFGTISPAGAFDSWTFTASPGDQIVLSVGRLSQTNGFEPHVELRSPTGATLTNAYASCYYGDAGELSWTATDSGTYTVLVNDFSCAYDGLNGTGTYVLYFAKIPGAFLVPPGDEGGALTNGGNHEGTITIGDLDLWTFTAAPGDSIALGIASQTGNNSFTPLIRLYSPDGTPTASSFNAIWGQVTVGGTWTVLVSDGIWYNDGYGGTGTYRLYYIKVPGAFVVPTGDEGGPVTNGGSYTGTILLSDIDPWTFTACAGNTITLQVTALSGTNGFTPWLRLYRWDGTLVGNASGNPTAAISGLVTNSGAYTALIADGSSLLNGTGTYLLTASGIFGPVTLDRALASGTNLIVFGSARGTNCTCVMLTSTNLTTPLPMWTPVSTNTFGTTGQFSFTNTIDLSVPQRYFRLIVP